MLSNFHKGLRRFVCAAALVVSFCAENVSQALEPRDYAVELTANVLTAPAQVQLSWPADANATSYAVSRKAPTATSWTSITSLAGTATGYADGNVAIGGSYEYRVVKSSSLGISATGYLVAGVDASLVENRGKLILVVDNTQASALASELMRLQQDLSGDGWMVIRKDVSPTATPASVKSAIKTEYDADRGNLKAVFLFGHVPVPRSGDINPDGHPDHKGAWAADTYYADMDGTWTDSSVNDSTSNKAENWNVPGDGKFDQGTIPSDLELIVGRVDLSNMTCYSNKTPSRSESDLLRAYLNKDHNFRHGLLKIPRRGLIADNFGDIYGESFAAIGWRTFSTMFGANGATAVGYGEYFPTLVAQPYLFVYACGGGSYYTCNGVGGSDDFALNSVQGVFTMHFGSYFGDWDNESNFMRASLGSGYVLTTSWAGRPQYFYHHMALGETVGYCSTLSENNSGLYEKVNQGGRGVNNGLLGDPTLRLHPVLPASNLTGTIGGSGLVLSWMGSSDTAIKGYNVYRATTMNGPFTRLNSGLLGATSFTDASPVANAIYMVRAVKLESTPSGTYYNASQGVFYTNTGTVTLPANPSRFVKQDSVTRGNWKGVYGSEGNWVVGASAAIPTYASVATIAPQWTWAATTTSPIAPSLPGASSSRIAACWYSATQAGFDFAINDGQLHRVSMYFMDWTASGRQQRVDLIDRITGATIDSRTLSGFSGGVYLTWDITGNVSLRMTPSAVNAVASAIFFDSATGAVTTPATAVRFVKTDSTTHGNWNGVYGADASIVSRDSARNASYASVTVSGQSEWTYSTEGRDARALVKNDGSGRIAGVWYSQYPTTNAFFIDVNITDGGTHQVALYALDWFSQGRAAQVDVINVDTGVVLDSRQLLTYNDGKYLVWDVKGRVRFRISTLAGANAMLSGVFLGAASAPL